MKVGLLGKSRIEPGRWRLAKVPYFSTNPVHAYAIDARMKELGRSDRYRKELAELTRSKNLPSDWAGPEDCYRAAIKAVGQYGQIIPLRKSRGE